MRRAPAIAIALTMTALLALTSSGCGRRSARGPSPVETTGTAPPDKATAIPPAARDTSGAMVVVDQPKPSDVVASPLVVRGRARGPWYFEATFPVRLLDENHITIATARARAQGEWTTPGFVPFEATLTFAPPASELGTIVLEKSNPSGRPEAADSVQVGVRFRAAR
jgi:hypothetical protein